MPGPTLSDAETAQLTKDKATQQNVADAMTAAIPQKQAKAAEYAVSDGAFKKFFDFYNTDIIGNYDAERRALNGQYIAAPISEADIVGPATLDGSVRTTPTTPVTDIIRVSQFDGGPLVSTVVNELQHIADQATQEDVLVNGYGAAHFNTLTATSNSSLSPTSTTLKVTDSTNPITIVVDDIFIVTDLTLVAVVKVTSVTPDPGTPPPYNFTYGITFIVAPTGTIASGSALKPFLGFTNSERTTKTPTTAALQPLMDYLVMTLQGFINDRKARLAEQLTALNSNQDPDGTVNITTAKNNVNSSNSFLTTYLITTDVSDTGLASLASERASRGSQITTRLAQILAAYTGQTKNYFNERYTFANNRANTSRGTLRLQKATEAAVSQLSTYAAGAAASVGAINSILP